MKRGWQQLKEVVLLISIFLLTLPSWADLPSPPSTDIANSSQDWIDVSGTLTYKGLKLLCVGLWIVILAVAGASIMKSYHAAQERHDLGHFFKWGFASLIAAIVGCALVYLGYTNIPTQSS